MRLFYGIEPEHPDIERLASLYRRLDPIRAWRFPPSHIQAAVDEIVRIVRARATADSFLASARRAHPDDADDETVLGNLAYMVQATGADVSGLLTWVLWMPSNNQSWVVRLRGEEQPDLPARRIVMETLRMEQSEFISRHAAEEIHWQGFVIPRGWRVRVCVRESHRDADIFRDPERFDPDRFLEAPGEAAHIGQAGPRPLAWAPAPCWAPATRSSGGPWPLVGRVLALGPAELESEYAPRFAQALGSLGLLLGVALFAAGFTTLGWVPVIGVAALQTLLAVTGYCVGCRHLVRPGSLAGRPSESESSTDRGCMRRDRRSLGESPERPDREADR